MYGLISLIAIAQADIAPEPPPDKQFTTYTVQIDGLDKFPDAVLVLHDKDTDAIRAYRPFSAEKSSHQIANGHASRGNNFHNPDLFFMTAEAYSAWSSEANAEIHEATTAKEILADFSESRLDYWVTGYGTGGTVTGVARALRRERPECRIILSEPHNAALLGSGEAQARNDDGSPDGSHPAWEPHLIQGWTPDFIPLVLQEGIDHNGFDKVMPVDGQDGMYWAQRLAREEGILTGVSGGSTLATAIEVAEQAEAGSVMLVMLPDTGERYLSTPLFESIPAEMTPEEQALADS